MCKGAQYFEICSTASNNQTYSNWLKSIGLSLGKFYACQSCWHGSWISWNIWMQLLMCNFNLLSRGVRICFTIAFIHFSMCPPPLWLLLVLYRKDLLSDYLSAIKNHIVCAKSSQIKHHRAMVKQWNHVCFGHCAITPIINWVWFLSDFCLKLDCVLWRSPDKNLDVHNNVLRWALVYISPTSDKNRAVCTGH